MSNIQHSAKGTTWEKRGHRWVRRVKGPDGKWRYYYKDGGDKYGKYRGAFDKNHQYEYKKGEDLFDRRFSGGVADSVYSTQHKKGNTQSGLINLRASTVVEYEGSLTRGLNAASDKVSSLANKGKSFIDNLFKKK